MNKISFLDELLKLGGVRKVADELLSDAPSGLMSGEATPPAQVLRPAQASSRLPRTAKRQGIVQPGTLGGVTDAKDPIDKERFNRPWSNWR